MKKKIIVLAAACMLGLAGCRQETEESPIVQKKEEAILGAEISYEEFTGASDEKDKDFSYTYSYKVPIVTIFGKEEAAEKIQQQIQQQIDKFLEGVNNGEFGCVFELEDGSALPPSNQSLDWSVIRNDEQIISFCVTNEGYDNGAHGWFLVEYLNFYTKTGEMVTFQSLGDNFKQRSEELTLKKAEQMQALSDESIFFEDYESYISLIVQDGAESANSVYNRLYGFDYDKDNDDFKMPASFAVTETGFIFTSGQYVLQPYACGIIDFTVNVMEYGEDCKAEYFDMDKAAKEYAAMKEEEEKNKELLPITSTEVVGFSVSKSAEEAVLARLGSFDDTDKIMSMDFKGTWYNPDTDTALRFTSNYAYVYYPALDEYGDRKYRWKIVDRSENGLCPMLALYDWETEVQGLTYYVGGCEDEFFWCNSQSEIFYKQYIKE